MSLPIVLFFVWPVAMPAAPPTTESVSLADLGIDTGATADDEKPGVKHFNGQGEEIDDDDQEAAIGLSPVIRTALKSKRKKDRVEKMTGGMFSTSDIYAIVAACVVAAAGYYVVPDDMLTAKLGDKAKPAKIVLIVVACIVTYKVVKMKT